MIDSKIKDSNNDSQISEKIFELFPISKEFQQQKLNEIIQNLQFRLQQNNAKMTVIVKTLINIKKLPQN